MQSNNPAFLQPSPAITSQDFLTPQSNASLSLTNFESAEGDDSVYYTLNNSEYSTTLEDILSEDGEIEDSNRTHEFEDAEDDEGFLYTGVDAVDAGSYKEQLKDVLGEDAEPDSEAEVEQSLSMNIAENEDENEEFSYERERERELLESSLPLEQSDNSIVIPTIMLSPSPTKPVKRPFLHPSVSRLRSITPLRMMPDSPDTSVMSPAPSNLSSLSRRSSILSEFAHMNGEKTLPREAFRWSPLKIINSLLFSNNRNDSDPNEHGEPTVITTNGLICIGTQKGRVLVFDFKQKLKCVCGASASAQEQGAVTAVALSQDHTFVAAGHASGHIFLYNLEKPNIPARSVPTTTLNSVASGRKEGHLANARISRIGFVGKRHTGIISSDENGLAFYHSLGKVLFIEANDVLRVLGKYPSGDVKPPPLRRHNALLAMSPLPLGGIPDPVDEYNLTALLTPIKLVIVGLKPSPRTWYRQHRSDPHPPEDSLWRGCLAWQPLIKSSEDEDANTQKGGKGGKSKTKTVKSTRRKSKARPLLAYSWGKECHVLAVREEVTTAMLTDPKTGKLKPVHSGKVLFEEQLRWDSSQSLIAMQWLNGEFILGITVSHAIQVWDIRSGSLVESASLGSLLTSWSPAGEMTRPLQPGDDFGQGLKTYKDKVFILHCNRLMVGSLLHWTDRILSYVQEGDFLSAIDLTRAYYLGDAPGNQIGLPDDPTTRRQVLGAKLKELMIASIAYSFSEDRLTDQTHVTRDGRGVDRTSLFENLVGSCAKSCIELDDLDLLYEDLYERYNDWGITSIFLVQLEPFVLDNQITYVPPRITQQIIARHLEKDDLSGAERLIWHIDPQCLDIDQAITLCKQHDLWDAMIYVYCSALRDFVSPIVEILGLIRWILQLNKKTQLGISLDLQDENRMEKLTPVSYKLFPYLSSVLSGLRYPSQLPMEPAEAFNAKEEIYAFLFSGRSAVWPKGDTGELVATTLDEGGIEPTYPYLRLLLRYDAEAFLNSLDIAFEDSFLNEGSGHVNRLLIVKILLDVQESTDLPSWDITLINIFISRNVPKYPQYLGLMPASTLQTILLSLIEDSDAETLEDRQLAAEFLLSAFRPHRTDELEKKMRDAGFYRVLRNWYQQDHKWPELLEAYVDDSTLTSTGLVEEIDAVLGKAKPSEQLHGVLIKALPRLVDSCLGETAILVDRHVPELHGHILKSIGNDRPAQQLAYLQQLVGDEGYGMPSSHLTQAHREKYLDLLCRLQSGKVIPALKQSFPSDSNWDTLENICLASRNHSAAIWCVYTQNRLKDTFSKWEAFNEELSEELLRDLKGSDSDSTSNAIDRSLESIKRLQVVALEICEAQSVSQSISVDNPVEDMWLSTLASQINTVQRVSSQHLSHPTESQSSALKVLRGFVEETLSVRMRVGSSDPAEFPNLFKRLVDATASTRSNSESSYSEFRLILGEMLSSYRSEGDLLESVNVLGGKDLLDTVKQLSKARNRGWRPSEPICQSCSVPVDKHWQLTAFDPGKVIISRTGAIYHKDCVTSE